MAEQTNQLKRIPDIPHDVIRDILVWLPVKSLCRFKCVSNTWLSLICEPRFVNSHFSKAFEHQHVFHQRRRVLIREDKKCDLQSLNLDEFLTHSDDMGNDLNDDNVGIVVPSTQLEHRSFTKFVMHANGLLLLLNSNFVFYLLNPATREHKVVPDPPGLCFSYDSIYGFGFDVSSKDYKAVWGKFSEFDVGFSVYSLKTGSWRAIEERYRYGCIQSGTQGRVLNGRIHWLVSRYCKAIPSIAMLYFSLADEEVEELSLPPELLGVDLNQCFLDIFEEFLCVGKAGDFEFWVMREYVVAESWSKISISMHCTKGLFSGFVKKDHHLLHDLPQHGLVMYNFEDGSSRKLSVPGSDKVNFVGCYLESHVSPNHYRMTDREHLA